MNLKNMTEAKLQQSIFIWHWNHYPDRRQMLFSVTNNSYNSMIGLKMKNLGVVSGVSDLICILPGKVVFIELKLEKGKQSETQRSFEKAVIALGHEYIILRNLEDFIEWIIKEID